MRISGINNFYTTPKKVGFSGELKLVDRKHENGNTTDTQVYYPCCNEPEYYIYEVLRNNNIDLPKEIGDVDGTKTTYYEKRTTLGAMLPFTREVWDEFSEEEKESFIKSLNED